MTPPIFLLRLGLMILISGYGFLLFVYYEVRKRELNIRLICECRCDERLKAKTDPGIYTSRIRWVASGTGIPKDRDEVNRREVVECDG